MSTGERPGLSHPDSPVAPCDVLAVFAHPDDESLLAGGALAACATAGQRVGLVSLTRGEAGPIALAGLAREDLGAARAGELAAAGRVLGAAWSCCLSLPDGELNGSALRAQRAIEGVIGRASPRAVLTFAADGLYWHPDHLVTHEIVNAAAGGLPVLEFTWPQGLLTRVAEELRSRGLPDDLWGLEPDAFGTPHAELSPALDVSRFLDAKLRALAAHRSQMGDGHALSALPQDLAQELLGREWITRSSDGAWLTTLVTAASDGVDGR